MDNSIGAIYLDSAVKRFLSYKALGDATFAQLEEKDFHFVPGIAPSAGTPVAPPAPDDTSNSIAVIIRHLNGNMLSRWTNFLTEDGEKPGRNRDAEFTPQTAAKSALVALWEEGWDCLLAALRALTPDDLPKTIHIRHEPLIVIDAINRQLAHYPHHVGQIVYIGKLIRGEDWKSLSIPKGASQAFNRSMEKTHTP